MSLHHRNSKFFPAKRFASGLSKFGCDILTIRRIGRFSSEMTLCFNFFSQNFDPSAHIKRLFSSLLFYSLANTDFRLTLDSSGVSFRVSTMEGLRYKVACKTYSLPKITEIQKRFAINQVLSSLTGKLYGSKLSGQIEVLLFQIQYQRQVHSLVRVDACAFKIETRSAQVD